MGSLVGLHQPLRKVEEEAGSEFEITNAAQREQAIAQLARRGATVIVAVGFTQASAVEKVAKDFPNVKFTLIDAVVDLPNVQSVVFREQESSFLCGLAAALAVHDVRDQLLAQGAEPSPGSPAAHAAYIASELKKWGKGIADIGVKVD